jgi:rhodanese-related sulfurtransferase
VGPVQVIKRAVLLVLMGAALGLLSNAVAPKGISLLTPPKKVPKADEFVPVDQAHQWWSEGNTFFLDARKPEDFEAGHIANALNLPVETFTENYPKVAPLLAPDSSIVVYCDGAECELSRRLAEELRGQGYTNVHMLHNGWTAWRTAGFPTATGPNPQ